MTVENGNTYPSTNSSPLILGYESVICKIVTKTENLVSNWILNLPE